MATIQPVQIPQNYNAVKIDINNPQVQVPEQKKPECQNCTAPIYEYPQAPIYEVPKEPTVKETAPKEEVSKKPAQV